MKHNIALVIIATGKYDQFVEPLLNSARKYFLIQDDITFYIFTDKVKDYGEDCLCIPTKKEPWPKPTLYRYRYILSSKHLFNGIDYIFYVDADSLFVDYVGREILGEGLTATRHPGFAMFPGTGSWGNNKNSTSYQIKSRDIYFAGGFQGGTTKEYLNAAKSISENIRIDESKNIIAEWHDETHWNKHLSEYPAFIKCLTPSYCMVEQSNLRVKWKIDHLKPKILALEKNYAEVRSL